MSGWIHVEGKVWNKNTCETPRCNHQIVPGNRDADYVLRDIEFAVRIVYEKLKKEGTSDPEIEITFGKDDFKNCLDAVKKQGQEEVWEMIRRMYLDTEYAVEAYTKEEMGKVFGTYYLGSILDKPLSEILEKDRKLREEVKARSAIKVGDWVTYDGPMSHYEGVVLTTPVRGAFRVLIAEKNGEIQTRTLEASRCTATGDHSYCAEELMALFKKGETE